MCAKVYVCFNELCFFRLSWPHFIPQCCLIFSECQSSMLLKAITILDFLCYGNVKCLYVCTHERVHVSMCIHDHKMADPGFVMRRSGQMIEVKNNKLF